jgi:hypothetical protein
VRSIPVRSDEAWRVIRELANRDTINSVRRTLNAAILMLAMKEPSMRRSEPRKGSRICQTAFLGLAGLLVGQHEQLVQLVLRHF